MKNPDFVLEVLRAIYKLDLQQGEVYISVDGDEVSFAMNANDLFWWGTADAEPITPENLPEIRRVHDDLSALEGREISRAGSTLPFVLYTHLTPTLFACRSRQMRPQGAYYKHVPKPAWPLFDACGPPRDEKGPLNTPKPEEPPE